MSNFLKQVFCLKQELLIIVRFSLYQLKLSCKSQKQILNIAVMLCML